MDLSSVLATVCSLALRARRRALPMPESDEPAIHPKPSPIERSLNRALQRSASVLTSAVALLLIIFVVLSLMGIVLFQAVVIVERVFFPWAVDLDKQTV